MSNLAIDIDNLSLTLKSAAGKINILRHVNLKVKEGESVAVVGPSGAGKTSLIMMIAGLERVTEGKVHILGREISGLSEDQLAVFRRDNVGVIFQDFHLIPTMSVHENVAVPLEFAGVKDAFDRASKALDAVGLSHRLEHFPSQISGGEQQRVAMARAFAVKPKLILADEPTGNLDSENGEKIMDLLFQLNKEQGTTVVLITHDKNLAKRCKRTVKILDGVIDGAND